MPDTLLNQAVARIAGEAQAKPFDCIVVGGGSSGLTTALTLVEHNPALKIAILESGPAPFLTHLSNTELRFAADLLRSVREAVAYSPIMPDGTPFGPNYGCLGGRGLFWNGAAPRFRPHDFSGWPLTAEDLDADYAWAESEFRVTRKVGESALAGRMISALHGAGIRAEPGPFAVDPGSNGPGTLGAGIASGLSVFFRRAGSAVVAGSIRIATGATVHRVLHENGTVRGVRVTGADAGPLDIPCRSAVLAAGGVESIRLALLSGIPDASGRIGFGVQEHHFYDCWFDATSLYRESPDIAIVYVPSTSQDTEQWEFHAPGRSLFNLDDGQRWQPSAIERYRVMVRSFCGTDKQAENRVEARDGPRGSATVHFSHTERDRSRRAGVIERARVIRQALEMTPVGVEPVDSLNRFRRPGSSYHEAGGLDMGADPTTSVTDVNGCFHRAPMLVCSDAAAFPRIGATNPHLTIVALARRKARALAANLS